MATGVQVKGLKQTIRSLERLGVEVQDLKSAFKRIGSNVASDARSRVHNRTGRLAGSIRPSNTKNKSVIRAGGARVPYAGVIHYGGYHGIVGQRYLTDAVESKESESVRILDQELNRLISRLDLK